MNHWKNYKDASDNMKQSYNDKLNTDEGPPVKRKISVQF